MANIVTEIRSFYSIKEIIQSLEEDIEQYKAVVDEYSQWLGSFLRNLETIDGDKEWSKMLGEMRKNRQKGKRKAKKTSGKKSAANWIEFKSIELSASEVGEAEILFDAIEEIQSKIENLEEVKETIAQMEKSGLGRDIICVTYIRDGVPEKIALRHKKDQRLVEKFKYIADFSVIKTSRSITV